MKCAAEFRLGLAVALCGLLLTPAQGSFEPLPVGGRAAGMGEAYSAIADDVFSLYYNPAGVLQVSRPEVGTYYSQLYAGLTDSSQISRMFLGYAQPFGKTGRHAIGASYLALDLPGLYKEESMGITYGRESNRLWNYGMTLKLLKKSIGSDDYTNNAIDPISGTGTGLPDPLLASGTSKSAIGLDLGGQYRLSRAYAVGFAARNINGPNIGLEGSDKAPAVLSAAIARRTQSGSLNFEVTNWKSAGSNLRFALGGEKWMKNGFGLRGGGAFGSRSYQTVSFGASYRLDSLQFDYALVYPLQGIEGTMGIQQLSLAARFGKPPVDPLEKQLIREKEERIKAETEARNATAERDRLKKQLLTLTSEKTRVAESDRRTAAQKALEEAQAAEARSERGARRTLLNNYTAALSSYNDKVAQGIGLPEKRKILEKIQADYSGKGIDQSSLTRELRSLRDEETKAKKDFDLSMSFYLRLVQQGSSAEERRSMLERIIQKYKEAGIDVRAAEEELRRVK